MTRYESSRCVTVAVLLRGICYGESLNLLRKKLINSTMVHPPINLIVARCKNKGIGYKGQLPWRLRKEMQHFERTTKALNNPEKKVAVIMGRRTWDSLPKKPLPGRLNFVLSTQPLKLKEAIHCLSFDDLMMQLKSPEYLGQIETAWIIGGRKLYEEALQRDICHRLYLTEILQEFQCDVFFDVDVNSETFEEVSDERVPKGIQEENGIQYVFHVYEKRHLSKTSSMQKE